jgi:MFS family permease
VLPPFTLWNLQRSGAGAQGVLRNLAAAGALASGAWLLIGWLGNPAQWIALALGLYAAVSWAQSLTLRDRPAFALIFRTPTLLFAAPGFSFLAFTGYGIGFWTPPFFMRVHGVSVSEAGTILGLTAAVAGWLGVTLGGVWADRWRQERPDARILVGLCAAVLPVPFAIWMLTTESRLLAYVLNFFVGVGASMWIGAGASTVQDLVLPRMRALASAAYLLSLTFIGLALGPYTIGRISVALDDDLRSAMLLGLFVNALAATLLLLASRRLHGDEQTRLDRARAAGEPD